MWFRFCPVFIVKNPGLFHKGRRYYFRNKTVNTSFVSKFHALPLSRAVILNSEIGIPVHYIVWHTANKRNLEQLSKITWLDAWIWK